MLYTIDEKSLTSSTPPIQTQINIYTDRSKTCDHTGAGYTIISGENELATGCFRLSHNATVVKAEIIAIREAVKYFIGSKNKDKKYNKIITDSQAALQAQTTTTHQS